MIKLIVPEKEYFESYKEAYNEYIDNNISSYNVTNPYSCDIFVKFDNYRNERNLPSNRVGADYFWLVDDRKKCFIGEVNIRHRLNDELLVRGGHIGYWVRYLKWNQGYGTKMLSLALEKAKEMKISPVLVTCNDDNIGSARVMEKNGFVLENKVVVSQDGKDIIIRRYWKELF